MINYIKYLSIILLLCCSSTGCQLSSGQESLKERILNSIRKEDYKQIWELLSDKEHADSYVVDLLSPYSHEMLYIHKIYLMKSISISPYMIVARKLRWFSDYRVTKDFPTFLYIKTLSNQRYEITPEEFAAMPIQTRANFRENPIFKMPQVSKGDIIIFLNKTMLEEK